MTPRRTCSLDMWYINLSGYCEQGPPLFAGEYSSTLRYSNHQRLWGSEHASNTFSIFQTLKQHEENVLIDIYYYATLFLFLLFCRVMKKVMFSFKSCFAVMFVVAGARKALHLFLLPFISKHFCVCIYIFLQ